MTFLRLNLLRLFIRPHFFDFWRINSWCFWDYVSVRAIFCEYWDFFVKKYGSRYSLLGFETLTCFFRLDLWELCYYPLHSRPFSYADRTSTAFWWKYSPCYLLDCMYQRESRSFLLYILGGRDYHLLELCWCLPLYSSRIVLDPIHPMASFWESSFYVPNSWLTCMHQYQR